MTPLEVIAAKVRGADNNADGAAILKRHGADVDLAAECLGDILTALTSAKEGYEIIEDKQSGQLVTSLTNAITDIKSLLENGKK